MTAGRKAVEVYRVFDSEKEQKRHTAFMQRLSAWNTVTAIVLIVLFWLYQRLFGANIHSSLL